MILKRIKNLWGLSAYEAPVDGAYLVGKNGQVIEIKPQGDGKATFIGEGTEKEHTDFENEKKGLKGIFGL